MDIFSFGALTDTESLTRIERIKRDFFIYLDSKLKSALYDRTVNSPVKMLENSDNSAIYDELVKVEFVKLAGNYNLTAQIDYRVIVGYDMVIIEREDNYIFIYVGFFPAMEPLLQNLQALTFRIGG